MFDRLDRVRVAINLSWLSGSFALIFSAADSNRAAKSYGQIGAIIDLFVPNMVAISPMWRTRRNETWADLR